MSRKPAGVITTRRWHGSGPRPTQVDRPLPRSQGPEGPRNVSVCTPHPAPDAETPPLHPSRRPARAAGRRRGRRCRLGGRSRGRSELDRHPRRDVLAVRRGVRRPRLPPGRTGAPDRGGPADGDQRPQGPARAGERRARASGQRRVAGHRAASARRHGRGRGRRPHRSRLRPPPASGRTELRRPGAGRRTAGRGRRVPAGAGGAGDAPGHRRAGTPDEQHPARRGGETAGRHLGGERPRRAGTAPGSTGPRLRRAVRPGTGPQRTAHRRRAGRLRQVPQPRPGQGRQHARRPEGHAGSSRRGGPRRPAAPGPQHLATRPHHRPAGPADGRALQPGLEPAHRDGEHPARRRRPDRRLPAGADALLDRCRDLGVRGRGRHAPAGRTHGQRRQLLAAHRRGPRLRGGTYRRNRRHH
ncbi:hypothetical protein BZZ08_07223 [Streptomyces sp. MH60]|nr:hypothetical protein BZZ08_07223 [Streptomyces sp. MH60]